MKFVISIITSLFAGILGFVIPVFLVISFRYQFYPSLQEFDVVGIILALFAGIIGAILSVKMAHKWTKRYKV